MASGSARVSEQAQVLWEVVSGGTATRSLEAPLRESMALEDQFDNADTT